MKLNFGISNTEKIICLYYTEFSIIHCYNGEDFIMSKDEYTTNRKNPHTSTYQMVGIDDSKLPIEEQYKNLIEEADKLKKLTTGRMNRYKTGTVAKTALKLFSDFTDIECDDIKAFEVEILEKTYKGALIYAEPYTGKGYKQDFVSMYPSIIRSDMFNFPIKEGTLKTITIDEFNKMKFFSYGIYHVKVHNTNKKLFSCSHDDWYVHTDLNRAMELKYKIELIEVENNFLCYKGCLANGAKVFRPYIDYLFPFKKDGHSFIKKYLNILPGKLCQKNTLKLYSSRHSLKKNARILKINRASVNEDDKEEVAYVASTEKYYETNFARMYPFMVSKARYMMSKLIESQVDDIKWLHTDGWISCKRMKNVKFGDEIGMIKNEGKCKKCVIVDATHKTGEFVV